jgi:hypothetical protein
MRQKVMLSFSGRVLRGARWASLPTGQLGYALCAIDLKKDGVGRAIAFAPNSCEGEATCRQQ